MLNIEDLTKTNTLISDLIAKKRPVYKIAVLYPQIVIFA